VNVRANISIVGGKVIMKKKKLDSRVQVVKRELSQNSVEKDELLL
jgi:hypothetical protein